MPPFVLLAETSAPSYRIAYLVGALLFMLVWGTFFWRRVDLRREMVVMGLLALVGGLTQEYFILTRDWWHPQTVTHTRIGIEDALFAFSSGGLLATVFTVAFRYRTITGAKIFPLGLSVLPYLLIFTVPLLLVPAGLDSFQATTVGTLLGLALVLWLRPDLTPVALGSGLLALVLAMPVYWICLLLFPGVIAAFWDLKHLSGLLVFGIPIEDLVWFVYIAAFYGTYFKLLTGGRIESRRTTAPALRRFML